MNDSYRQAGANLLSGFSFARMDTGNPQNRGIVYPLSAEEDQIPSKMRETERRFLRTDWTGSFKIPAHFTYPCLPVQAVTRTEVP
jgi:hypothetical protein